MTWALFKDGKQISIGHPHKVSAIVEAFEAKVVVTTSGDWPLDRPMPSPMLMDGYTVEEVD